MTADEIIELIADNADSVQAKKMSAYMKNLFPFAGVPKPKLRELMKPALRNTARLPLDRLLVFDLWDAPFREAQYAALEYLQKHRKQLLPSDIDFLRRLIIQKPWWDTVDTIDAFVGDVVLNDASLKAVMTDWASSDNLWLRRTAIDFQQKYKDATDTELLRFIILQNLGSREFFINKAIGWSLREYGKTNPEWVRGFIDEYGSKMAALSVKEAMRRLT